MWRKLLVVIVMISFFTLSGDAILVEVVKKIIRESAMATANASQTTQNIIVVERIRTNEEKLEKVRRTCENVVKVYQSIVSVYDSKEFDNIQSIILLGQLLDNISCMLTESKLLLQMSSTNSCYFQNVNIINSINLTYSTDLFTSLSSSFNVILSSKGKSENLKNAIASLQKSMIGIERSNNLIKAEVIQNIQNEYLTKNMRLQQNYSLTR